MRAAIRMINSAKGGEDYAIMATSFDGSFAFHVAVGGVSTMVFRRDTAQSPRFAMGRGD